MRAFGFVMACRGLSCLVLSSSRGCVWLALVRIGVPRLGSQCVALHGVSCLALCCSVLSCCAAPCCCTACGSCLCVVLRGVARRGSSLRGYGLWVVTCRRVRLAALSCRGLTLLCVIVCSSCVHHVPRAFVQVCVGTPVAWRECVMSGEGRRAAT